MSEGPAEHERPHTSSTAPPRWVTALDLAVLGLFALALHVAFTGGFRLWVAGVRVSVTSAPRLVLWGLMFVLLRSFHRPFFHQRVISWFRFAKALLMKRGRAEGPLVDDGQWLIRGLPPEWATAGASLRWKKVAGAAIVLVFFTGLTSVMTFPQVRYIADGVSDLMDPLFSAWRLAWVAHQLPRDPLHLFDANIFYPQRYTLANSDSMIVPALIVAPLLWLGAHPILAHNLLFLSGFIFSGVGTFLLVRSLTHHVGAAAFAGVIFAFHPYRFLHYSHLELQITQWMPFGLWLLHKTIRGGRRRDGLLLGVFVALQTLSSMYYGIFFASYLFPVGGALLLGTYRDQAKRALRPLIVGGVVAAILIAPVAIPYLVNRQVVGERRFEEIEFYSAKPHNYLGAHHRNVLYGARTARFGGWETDLFQGIVVTGLAVIGMWPPLSAARIAYTLGLLFAFEVSLGLHGVLYEWLRALVFPYRGLRVPARMSILVGLSLAILGGYGVARLCSAVRRVWIKQLMTIAFILGALFEYRSNVRFVSVWKEPPPVYNALRSTEPTVLVELPMTPRPDFYNEAVYMYFSTFHWHKLVNGYSGFGPPEYFQLLESMRQFPDDESLEQLRARGVEFAVVHEAFSRPGEHALLVSRVEQRPDMRLVGSFRWGDTHSRLYRLLKP